MQPAHPVSGCGHGNRLGPQTITRLYSVRWQTCGRREDMCDEPLSETRAGCRMTCEEGESAVWWERPTWGRGHVANAGVPGGKTRRARFMLPVVSCVMTVSLLTAL